MSEFTRFRVQQLTPACGAELLECDLSRPVETLTAEVRASLLKYRVVFFRDQNLNR